MLFALVPTIDDWRVFFYLFIFFVLMDESHYTYTIINEMHIFRSALCLYSLYSTCSRIGFTRGQIYSFGFAIWLILIPPVEEVIWASWFSQTTFIDDFDELRLFLCLQSKFVFFFFSFFFLLLVGLPKLDRQECY